MAADDYTQADLGLVEGGFVSGVFNQDTTSIVKGDALVMEGTTDFRVQQADTQLATNCVGFAATDSLNATPVAGDEIAVVPRGPIVKAKLDASTDISPGDLLILDTGGALKVLTAFEAFTTTLTTDFNKVHAIVAMALQNHDEDGDNGLVMVL